MAAAYAVMELIEPGETQVRFDTLSGRLTVDKTPDGLCVMENEALVRAAQPDLAKVALFSVGEIFLPPDAK